MSTFSLSGTGVQALSAGTTALRVTITTLPAGLPAGNANPTNHYKIGLLRFGDGTAYFEPIAIVGGPQWIGLPYGTISIGYALLNGAVVSVVEVFGTSSPIVTAPYNPQQRGIIQVGSAESVGQEMQSMSVSVSPSVSYNTANQARLVPFVLQASWQPTFMFVLNGTTVAGHFDLGIYDSALALIAHTGSVLQFGGSLIQKAAISVPILSAGRYYFAISSDSTTSTMALYNTALVKYPRSWGCLSQASAFPLPSTITPAAFDQNGIVFMGGTDSTLIA